MGFNYFFNYFIKRFISLFVRKFFYIILIIFITALIFFIGSYIGLNKCQAITTDEVAQINTLYETLRTKIATDSGVTLDPTSQCIMIFYDFTNMTYNVLCAGDPQTHFGIVQGSQEGLQFQAWFSGRIGVSVFRYDSIVTYSTDSEGYKTISVEVGTKKDNIILRPSGLQTINSAFGLTCFNKFNYIFGFGPSGWGNLTYLQEFNQNYGKIFPQPPRLLINNGTLDFNGYFKLDPGDCYFDDNISSDMFQFYFDLYYMDENENVSSSITTSFFANFTTYWDSDEKLFIIPLTNFNLIDGYLYQIKYSLFGRLNVQNDFFYENFLGRVIKWNDFSYGLPSSSGGGGDENQTIEDILTDTTDPDDDFFELPSVEVNDTTANFFDALFMGLYNAFNTEEDITLTIPIRDHNYTISTAQFNLMNNEGFNPLKAFFSALWVFGIGYWILKDIRKIFDRIKDGNVEGAVNEDVKANMM